MAHGKLTIEAKLAKFTGPDRKRVEEIIKPFLAIPKMSIEEINALANLYSKEKRIISSSNSSYLTQRHDELKATLINSIMKRACSVALIRANTPDELEDYINQAILSGMEFLERYNGDSDFYGVLNSIISRTLDVHTGRHRSKSSAELFVSEETSENVYLITVEHNSDSTCFFAYCENPSSPCCTPAVTVEYEELKKNLEQVLSTLTPREERILRLCFGLEDGRERTLSEIGAEFHIGGNRVRQIEAKALRKLRHPSRAKFLIEFLD